MSTPSIYPLGMSRSAFSSPYHHGQVYDVFYENPSKRPSEDWSEALQEGNDYLYNTFGGGVLLLPPFLFNLSGVFEFDKRVSIVGFGKHVTNVNYLEGGAFRCRGFLDLKDLDDADVVMGYSGGIIKDFQISANNIDVIGLGIYGPYYDLENLLIREAGQQNLWTQYRGDGPFPVDSKATRINRLVLLNGAQGNWMSDGPHDSYSTQIEAAINNVPGITPEYNVRVARYSSGLQFTDSHIWGGLPSYGLDVLGGACRMSNIVSEGARIAQLKLELEGGSISFAGGNLFAQGIEDRVGVMLSGVSNSDISFYGGNLNGGMVAFDGLGGTVGSGNGDFGGNRINVLSSSDETKKSFTGTPNASTQFMVNGGDNPTALASHPIRRIVDTATTAKPDEILAVDLSLIADNNDLSVALPTSGVFGKKIVVIDSSNLASATKRIKITGHISGSIAQNIYIDTAGEAVTLEWLDDAFGFYRV